MKDAERNAQERFADRIAELRLRRDRGKPVSAPPTHASRAVMKALKPILKDNRGLALTKLAARWGDIVGPRLAGLSTPVKVVNSPSGKTLVVRAPSAAAPMIQHQMETILQRVNLAGGGGVKTIKIDQTKDARRRMPAPKPSRPLAAQDRQALEARLAPVKTDRLRAALQSLGESVLRKNG